MGVFAASAIRGSLATISLDVGEEVSGADGLVFSQVQCGGSYWKQDV